MIGLDGLRILLARLAHQQNHAVSVSATKEGRIHGYIPKLYAGGQEQSWSRAIGRSSKLKKLKTPKKSICLRMLRVIILRMTFLSDRRTEKNDNDENNEKDQNDAHDEHNTSPFSLSSFVRLLFKDM